MRVLALPYSHFLSHLSRPLMVARELRRRGHEVVFGGESPKLGFARGEGFKTVRVWEPRPETFLANLAAGKFRFVSEAELERMIRADLEAFQSVRPDLLLTDCRPSASISARAAGLRHAAITHGYCSPHRAVPSVPLLAWLPPALLPRRTRLWEALDALNVGLETFAFNAGMGYYGRLARRHGVAEPLKAMDCFAGRDLTLLADVPEFFPMRRLPERWRYVGPLTWKAAMPAPSWWPSMLGSVRRPLVYLSLGTSGTPDILARAVRSFAASPMTVVLSTGTVDAGVESVDGRLYAEPFLDADLAMEACDVVVSHGGHGTTYQALEHGKPLVGIPMTPGLRFGMRRVEALGLGRAVAWREFSRDPASLVRAVERVAGTGSFAARAREFQAILARHRGPGAAADAIEKLA